MLGGHVAEALGQRSLDVLGRGGRREGAPEELATRGSPPRGRGDADAVGIGAGPGARVRGAGRGGAAMAGVGGSGGGVRGRLGGVVIAGDGDGDGEGDGDGVGGGGGGGGGLAVALAHGGPPAGGRGVYKERRTEGGTDGRTDRERLHQTVEKGMGGGSRSDGERQEDPKKRPQNDKIGGMEWQRFLFFSPPESE